MTGPVGSDVPHEREAKVSVWPGFRVPDLAGTLPWVVTAPPQEQVLDARFVDAEDLRLLRMGITFRHRTGEGDPEGRWTLKLPVPQRGPGAGPLGDGGGRAARCATGPHDRGGPRVCAARRSPRCAHLQTQRRLVQISDPAERPLGVLTDDVVSALDGERVALRFREIEVEAAAGAPDSVIDAVDGRPARRRRRRAGPTCRSWLAPSARERWRCPTRTFLVSGPSRPRPTPCRTRSRPQSAGCSCTIPSSGSTPATRACTRLGWPPGACGAICGRSGPCSMRRR